ncbi:MAG: 6,7-dimethyl-8-ribityllumazine synthase [Acidobacteriia bacterium]|nr:6,7-dimethyl-8-ribityllumazine synthase [Terriglobia bacterium]
MSKRKLHRISGELDARGKKFGIVVSRFNNFIGERLLASALEALTQLGANPSRDVTVVTVPGAFEIPQAASRMARSKKFDALITLGCVIRGETPHFEYVCAACSKGIEVAALESKTPIAFGVLTCNNLEEAIQRAGGKAGNKGRDAALAAVEMAGLTKKL